MYSTKQNLFIELDDCKIAIKDENDNQCIIDKEDYDIIKNWYWRKIEKRGDINKGYWITNVKIGLQMLKKMISTTSQY